MPSKALLDEPYPANLPVVDACGSCNVTFSVDEEYLACLLECVVSGATEPEKLSRPKVSRMLRAKPALVKRLASAFQAHEQEGVLGVELDRVRGTILKLARGHAAHELSDVRIEEPTGMYLEPMSGLTAEQFERFEREPRLRLWPEIGSRAFQRAAINWIEPHGSWIEVQRGRYRYLATDNDGTLVRIVLSEYLACEVFWE